MSRRFPVTLWYSVEAALNMAEKLLSVEVEGPSVWLLADIGIAGGNWETEEHKLWMMMGVC